MKTIISSIIFILTILCMFFITENIAYLQFASLQANELPFSYNIISGISSSLAALTPLVVFVFLYVTIETMMNIVFEEHIKALDLYSILGFSFLPMLLYECFFWYNLIIYGKQTIEYSTEGINNMKFLFGLEQRDMSYINTCCWIALYMIIIFYFFFKGKSMWKTLVSVLLPTALTIAFYRLIG